MNHTFMKLHFTVEHPFWVCYAADMEDKRKPILLGQIVFNAVRTSPELKAEFMALMKRTLTIALKESCDIDIHMWNSATRY